MRNVNATSKESSLWRRRRTVFFLRKPILYKGLEVELKETIFDMVSKLFGKRAGGILIPEGNIFNGNESVFTICHTPGKILVTKGKRGMGALTSYHYGLFFQRLASTSRQ